MKSIFSDDFNELVFTETETLANELDVFHLIYTSNFIAVSQVIKNGSIPVHHKNNKGQTLLHYAILYNQIKIAEELISLGASLNAIDNEGNSVRDIVDLYRPDAQSLLYTSQSLISTKESLLEVEGQQYYDQDLHSLGCIKNNCEIF